jgi:hypothetical protein
MKTMLQDDTYADHFGALLSLFVRNYWMRLWVVQEVAFANKVLILCGGRQIYYSSLLEFLEALKAPELDTDDIAKIQWARLCRLVLPTCGPALLLVQDLQGAANTRIRLHSFCVRTTPSANCVETRETKFTAFTAFSIPSYGNRSE